MFFDAPQPPAIYASAHDVCINCIVTREKLKATNGCGEVREVTVYYSKFNGKAWTQPGFGYGSPRSVTIKISGTKVVFDMVLQPLN